MIRMFVNYIPPLRGSEKFISYAGSINITPLTGFMNPNIKGYSIHLPRGNRVAVKYL